MVLLCVALMLRERGMRVRFLGADTPITALSAAVQQSGLADRIGMARDARAVDALRNGLLVDAELLQVRDGGTEPGGGARHQNGSRQSSSQAAIWSDPCSQSS